MTLQEWREARGLTKSELGRLVGARSKTTVGRWEAGTRMPSRRHLQAIVALTEGKVTANDFMQLGAAA